MGGEKGDLLFEMEGGGGVLGVGLKEMVVGFV